MSGARRTVPRILMRVWDAPTRLFHWLVVLLIALSYSTMQNWFPAVLPGGYTATQLHFLSGYTILAMLLFRVAWGFVGSETSRFRHFLKNPAAGLRHLAQFARREPDNEIGHNAAGGWMVLLLLGAIAVQVGTGLFSNDDTDAQGPLAHTVRKATSDWLSGIHARSFWWLVALIGLHVLAVLAYAAFKRHDLTRAMVTGRKRLPANFRQPRMASPLLALAVFVLAACVVWVVVTRA